MHEEKKKPTEKQRWRFVVKQWRPVDGFYLAGAHRDGVGPLIEVYKLPPEVANIFRREGKDPTGCFTVHNDIRTLADLRKRIDEVQPGRVTWCKKAGPGELAGILDIDVEIKTCRASKSGTSQTSATTSARTSPEASTTASTRTRPAVRHYRCTSRTPSPSTTASTASAGKR